MIKAQWEKIVGKIDGLSLRERMMIFAAAAFLLVTLVNSVFINPLLAKQKIISVNVIQQQEKIKEIQANLEALAQAKRDDASSPLRDRIKQIQRDLNEGEAFIKSSRDKLVPPDKMGDLLEQVLSKNGRVQLLFLETLAVMPLIETSASKPGGGAVTVKSAGQERQVYKHGVKISVSGSYLDILQYLSSLEALPTQMFWGSVNMNTKHYPAVELTLILYTLSLDTIWLQV